MATVDVVVGGRSYQLGCENGQEGHLTALAAQVDAEVRALSQGVGPVGEARLLLMAALMIADRLNDATGAPGDPAEAAALSAAVGRLGDLVAAGERRR